jgi:hypothetical protein
LVFSPPPAEPVTEENEPEPEELQYKNVVLELRNSLENKHLHRINSDLIDLIESEQHQLKLFLELQRNLEQSIEAGKEPLQEAKSTNEALLELISNQREYIKNLRHIRGDSIHSERQASKLFQKLERMIKLRTRP